MNTLLTEWNQLCGKIIRSFGMNADYEQYAIIFFEDNTVAILESYSDPETGYHSNFQMVKSPTLVQQLDACLISSEEFDVQYRAKQLADAKRELASLQKNFPELF